MTVRWLSIAEFDFSEALDHYLYDEQSTPAAASFAEEIDLAIKAVQNSPLTFPIFEGDVRVKLVHKFPYSVLYHVQGQEVVILSIIHQERKPGYWKGRIR